MPDEIDFTNFDASDPEAIQRLRAAYERQKEHADKANHEVGELRAEQRSAQVKTILSNLKAPSQLAELYPTDQPVSEDALKTFLRDKVGLSPDVNDAWSRYDQLSNNSSPPPPETDPDVEWAKEELAKTEKFYRATHAPTDKELAELNESKAKMYAKLNQWDQDVMMGKMDRLVDPQGFGGFLDPPPYARRARHFVSTNS